MQVTRQYAERLTPAEMREFLAAGPPPSLPDPLDLPTTSPCRPGPTPPAKGALAGMSDYWEGSPDVRGALNHVPPHATVIVFTHNPDVFPEMPDRVAFSIAGHTHGGQVCLPIIGRPIVPSKFGERYAAGHVVENGRDFFVGTGLGTSIIPVRFGVTPEISLLTLRAPAR